MSPLPNDEDPEALAERILARFCDEGLSSISLRPEVKTELALEARPAVHALLFGLGTDRAGDASSLEHHESLAMVTLLGRALALSGATPTPVLRVVPALLSAFRAEGAEPTDALEAALQAVCLEGFVRGREEAVERRVRRGHEQAIAPFILADGVVALRLVGDLSADALVAMIEELGRALFRADARACVVDVNPLSAPTPRRARALLSAHEVALTLGVRCIYSGLDARWQGELRDVDLSTLTLADTFAEATALALAAAGSRIARASLLPGALRGLLR
ncbi:MAG: hypothetical protein KC593_21880 [Myxococcales bacterium]|nr:hypothetical protein [Myxococcales bacterium]MCB9626384.1 hypothetical protein [Sandaracinaceae bacterium]